MISRWFNSGIAVYRLTEVTDSWGGTSEQYPATATATIDGFIQPISGGETFENNGVVFKSPNRLYCASGADIITGDRIKYSGVTYEVRFIQPAGISGLSKHQEVLLERIDN